MWILLVYKTCRFRKVVEFLFKLFKLSVSDIQIKANQTLFIQSKSQISFHYYRYYYYRAS